MLNAVFTSLSGMHAYRTGLDVISNNVANMNTPGFKLGNPLFKDLVQQFGRSLGSGGASSQARGAGVFADETMMSFQPGELRETGNSLDAAIDGDGFFIFDVEGERVYSRAGQFEFNKDGILVERGSGAKVVVSTDTSSSTFFDINTVRVFPPRATGEVTLTGVLARGGTATSYELPQVTVIDSGGAKITLKARLNRDTADPLHWVAEIVDADNVVIGTGDIRFNADGTPAEGSSSLTVTVTPDETPAFDVVFNFGAPGTFGGVTSVAGTTTSQLQVQKQDGLELGSITKSEFDDHGKLQVTYSNGEKKAVATLVLAHFSTTDQLQSIGGGKFAFAGLPPQTGSALVGGFGRVVGGKIEMSNVDLTSQFTDLIIVQRGFQGSSQIASVANEMMQQLLAMNGSR